MGTTTVESLKDKAAKLKKKLAAERDKLDGAGVRRLRKRVRRAQRRASKLAARAAKSAAKSAKES